MCPARSRPWGGPLGGHCRSCSTWTGGSLLNRAHLPSCMSVQADLQQGTGQRTLQDVDADMEEAEASKGEQEGKRDQLVLRRDRMR